MWTEDQARALITDAGTLKRGLELASPAKWHHLGQTATAAWGECQGSGSKPYQTGIDLTEPAFKCSCPSRVFPCKHGAGLLLLLARQPQLLTLTVPPPWLQEWLDKREQTPSRKSATAPPAVQTSDPTATAAPEPAPGGEVSPARLERMRRGAAELLLWLQDLVGMGVAQSEKQPASFWENQAARLVDDQLPGLAVALRELPALRHTGADWPERLLARLGELYLLTEAFGHLDSLSAPLRADVLALVGVNVKKEAVLAQQPAVADTWTVVGQTTAEEERLLVRRSWLWGEATARYALVLEFSFGGQPFATPLVPGGRYRGALAFYPSALPLRAVTTDAWTFVGATDALPTGLSPDALLDAYATAVGQLPWLREWPAALTGVVPVAHGENGALYHAASGLHLPVRPLEAGQIWDLLAVSGGAPLTVFGEWNGHALRPLTYSVVRLPPAL